MTEELAATADALLLLGPAHEPSPGFESKVLTEIRSAQRPSNRFRSRLVAVAAVCVLVTGTAAFWLTSDDRSLAGHYRDALAVAEGEYLGVVPLRNEAGARTGHVFAYEGEPTWVFMIFDTPPQPGAYEAELETDGGEIISFGVVGVAAGDVTWGRDIPVSLRELRAVRLVDEDGVVVAGARFPAH